MNLFTNYDILCLSELKHCYCINLPGYKFIRSRVIATESHRGGVGVFVKHHLWPSVHNISILNDQVWFNITGIKLSFGCVYIPPRDSPYFSMQSFATLQEQCMNNDHILIIGEAWMDSNLTTVHIPSILTTTLIPTVVI